ncbi:hypothetical protein SAMN04487761_10843 [Lachnospiraceae bacterium C7]|nr:hypothetical protein SAMN04487761_10843 [Lachnospiraceae bacterium C7]
MKYEVLRLIRRKSVIAMLIVEFIVAIVFGIISVNAESATVSEDKLPIRGRSAFLMNEEKIKNNEPKLITSDNSQRIMDDIKQKKTDDDRGVYVSEKYPSLGSEILATYNFSDKKNKFDIKLNRANFIKQKMKIQNLSFPLKDNLEIEKRENGLGDCLKNGYCLPWKNLYSGMGLFSVLNIIVTILITTSSVLEEKKSNMAETIYCSKKNVFVKVWKNKALSMAFLVCAVYVISVLLMLCTFFMLGGKCSFSGAVQMVYYGSLYKGNMFTLLCQIVIMNILANVAVLLFTFIVGYKMKNHLYVMLISLFVVFAPSVLRRISVLPIYVQKFIRILPINVIYCKDVVESLYIYWIGSKSFLNVSAIQISCLIIILLEYAIWKTMSKCKA